MQGISVDPDLGEPLRLDIDVFKFFGSNILTLRKLENVFGSVNNLN
jgi:hypothetical protein